jgi:mono/diheme cytochrome c family protein
MIWLVLLLAQTGSTPDEISRGAGVFARTCAVGYCHGTAGAAGRAPRIQGRSFSQDYLLKVTREGIPGSGMPAWNGKLTDEDLVAVVAYMISISTPAPGGSPHLPVPVTGSVEPKAQPKMPPEVKQGRDLFFDATRGTRCGTCHALENWGNAIGPNLASTPPKSVSEIRKIPTSGVSTARLSSGGEFPAIVVERKDGFVRLYDFTAAPPILRTLAESDVSLRAESNWGHSGAISTYTDEDLEAIIRYLRWLASR